MYKKLLFLLVIITSRAIAQTDTTHVLFIGNSFTYTYNVPDLVQGLATAAGLPLVYEMHAPGGVSVGDVAQDTLAHMNNPSVFGLIRKGNWDFVSLQDNQGRFIYGGGIFPDTNVSKVIRGHLKIRDSVRHYNSCARMLWFAGWGPKNGYGTISTTGAGLIDNIYDNYKYLRDTAHEIISPIGKAWERAAIAVPAADCWGPDLTHESLAGAYLTASVIFTSIYRINTENIMFDGGLDTATARVFRRIAYQTVMDSIAPTNLAAYIPTLAVTATTLTATPGYSHYQWFHNGTAIGSGAANTFAVAASGCYYVIATNSSACSARSAEKCVGPLSAPALEAAAPLAVYPVPSTSTLNVDYQGNLPATAIITDAYGRNLKEVLLVSHQQAIPVSGLPEGMYFLTIANGTTIAHRAFVKN